MRKIWKILAVISVVALLFGGSLVVSVAATPDVTVSIDAPATAAADSDFTANVNITEVTDFDACNYNVSFNASVLRLDSVTSGLIDSTPVPVDIANELSPGTWTVVQNVSGLAGVDGSGYLAVLHFHVVGTGSSPISLSNGMLSNNAAEEIPATWVGDTVIVPGADTTPPTVSSVSPAADATDVAIDATVSVTFSEAMDESSITTSSFTLGGVSGSVSYNSGIYTATFTPAADLSYDTTYTANLSTAITDSAGNPLASAHSWSFTTVAEVVVTVSIDAPATAAADSDFTANVNITEVTSFDACNYDVSFNASVLRLDSVTSGLIDSTPVPVDIANELSPGTWTVVQNVSGLAGVSGSGYLAVLHFHVIGAAGTSSAISLSNGMLSNNAAEEIPATWVGDSVIIGPGVDTTPPTVSSVSPVADATGVAVSTIVSVTFSEAMDESTITTSSFTLDGVSGSVSYNSGTYTATFTPSASLAYSTTYTANLSTAITDAAGNPLASAYSWSFTTVAGDTTPPTVVSTSPANSATGVAISTTVSVTFSEAMNASTITIGSFTLSGVSGSVSYNSGTYTATFTPSASLAYSTTYTANLSTAITDAAGNPLAAYSWGFTTTSAPVGVTVSIDAPAAAAPDSDFTANVDITEVTDFDACNYNVSFNASVLRLDSVTSGLIDSTPVPVDIANELSPGTWTVVQNVSGLAGVDGSGYLAVLHFHVIGTAGTSSTINLSNGMLSNNAAEEIPATWVGDSVNVVGVDTTPPTVASTSPADDATGVAIDATVSVTFSEAMNASTITTGSFTLGGVSGSVSYNSGTYTATFTPSANLAYSTTYTANLSTAITDAAGNPLAVYSWSFTTVAGDTTPPIVVSVSPEADATDVALDTVVTATFNEAMNASTITTSSFTLDGVSGSVSYNSGTYTATFTPSADLSGDTTYTANLGTAITDAAGNPLASAYSWSFTTAMGDLQDEIDDTPPGGTLNLGCGTYSGDVLIDKPITITGSGECTNISGGITIGELTGSNVTIENLAITGYTDFGIKIIKVKAVDTFIIRNNTIQGVSGSIVGIEVVKVVAGGSLTIEQNTISGNQTGIKLQEDVADATIQFNDITGNTTGLEILAVASDADASYNWWDDISGPEEANNNPGGTGNKVIGVISYQPWLTREFQTVLDDNIAYFGYAMVDVSAGWNIISTPIALDPACDTWGEYAALGDGLALHATSPAYYFNSQTQAWVALTSDYALKPCDAIYVRMASADTAPILYSPNLSVPSKRLYSGWNLVGLAYVDDVGLKASEALVSVEEVSGGLTGYKLVVSPPVNQPSWIYTGGAIADWDGEGQPPNGWMLRTNGYWVFMLNDGTLAGFTFTPVSLDS